MDAEMAAGAADSAWQQQQLAMQGGFSAAGPAGTYAPSSVGGGQRAADADLAIGQVEMGVSRDGGRGRDGELTLLAKSQVQKIAVAAIMQSTGIPKVIISADAADALQKATTIFACYLTSSAHEMMHLQQEEQDRASKRQKVAAPKKIIESESVLLAADLVAPAIAKQLRTFDTHFDANLAKALQAQEKAERAKERKLQEQQQVQAQGHHQGQGQGHSHDSGVSSYEHQHLQQQMHILMQEQMAGLNNQPSSQTSVDVGAGMGSDEYIASAEGEFDALGAETLAPALHPHAGETGVQSPPS
jgi:hypothetical protein